MATYKIKNAYGQYWTGTCWGVPQDAKVYSKSESIDEISNLPDEIDEFGYWDGCYYRGDSVNAFAWVVRS